MHLYCPLCSFLKLYIRALVIFITFEQGSESSFEWSDGSALDYIPWKNQKSPGNCVILDPKGIWKHEKCNSVKDGAICYKSTKRKA